MFAAPRLSALLCRHGVLVALSAVPFVLAAGAQVHGAVAARSVASPVELPALRTELSRTFENPDGSFTDQVFSEPVNFKDANGAWQPIDSRLMPSSASGFAYENAANSFSVRFANSPAGTFSQFQTTAGRVSLSLLGVDPTALAAAKPPVVAAADGELVYPSVEPGVNLAYRVTATGVKESIVLARSDVPASYSFLLHPASGQQLSAKREPNWTSPVSVDTG